MNILQRQLRMFPSQYPKYRWRIAQVDPNKYAPTNTKSGCEICPAKRICATHNHFDSEGERFESDRYLLEELTPELITLAAKNIIGIGSYATITAKDIGTSHIAPLLPCTESQKYLGRPTQLKDHDHWIRPISEPDPLFETMRNSKSKSSRHWSDDI